MAGRYTLSKDSIETLRDVIMRVGGGKVSRRPVPTRRRSMGGGSRSVSLEGAVALLVSDVPAAVIDGTEKTATPGKGDGAAIMMDWKKTDDEYDIPLVDMVASEEADPDFEPPEPQTEPPTEAPMVDKVRDAVNYSMTAFRGSASDPLLVDGTLQEFGDAAVFVISSVFDMRALPGFKKGSAGTDADMQIPYHEPGAGVFQLDAEEC